MARMRIVKPEFFSSEQIAEVSTTARLLFVGMWCFSDDGGVHPASLARLKMEVFPADAFSQDDMRGWVSELISQGLVESYVVDGKEFWHVTGWHHQKIESPTYRYPRSQKFGEASARIRRGVVETSTPETRGDERSRVESKGEESIYKGDRIAKGTRSASGPSNGEPSARRRSPRSPVDAFDLGGVDWARVEELAERLGRKVKPRTVDDRRMWLRFAVLADMSFGEAWLVDGTEAVLKAKETRSTRQAHLVGVLKAKASEEHGVDEANFLAMLSRIEIPKSVWKSGVLEIQK